MIVETVAVGAWLLRRVGEQVFGEAVLQAKSEGEQIAARLVERYRGFSRDVALWAGAHPDDSGVRFLFRLFLEEFQQGVLKGFPNEATSAWRDRLQTVLTTELEVTVYWLELLAGAEFVDAARAGPSLVRVRGRSRA